MGRESASISCSCCRRPRAVADTVLHGAVHEHLEGFLAEAAARTDAVALPRLIAPGLRAAHPPRPAAPAARLGRRRAAPELGPGARPSLALCRTLSARPKPARHRSGAVAARYPKSSGTPVRRNHTGGGPCMP